MQIRNRVEQGVEQVSLAEEVGVEPFGDEVPQHRPRASRPCGLLNERNLSSKTPIPRVESGMRNKIIWKKRKVRKIKYDYGMEQYDLTVSWNLPRIRQIAKRSRKNCSIYCVSCGAVDWQPKRRSFGSHECHIYCLSAFIHLSYRHVCVGGTNKNLPSFLLCCKNKTVNLDEKVPSAKRPAPLTRFW